MQNEMRRLKARVLRRARAVLGPEPALEEQAPWMSPDVWRRIERSYEGARDPRVFEYGLGVSTLWHVRNLVSRGGAYAGVEHRPDWYLRVLEALVRLAVRGRWVVHASGAPRQHAPATRAYAVGLKLRGPEGAACDLDLRLAPPPRRSADRDGMPDEFRDYVAALQTPCDLVVVDGMARKACVSHALEAGRVKPGGTLVLCEAGSGSEGWLGQPARTGSSDYQPEVRRMLALGGELMDGEGLDRWPGATWRVHPRTMAEHYPREACFLRISRPLPPDRLDRSMRRP